MRPAFIPSFWCGLLTSTLPLAFACDSCEDPGLKYQVFYSNRTSATQDAPPGLDQYKWVPSTSTLLHGKKDAVLIDTPITIEAITDLGNWVLATGKNVTHIYVTHAHPDHYYGNHHMLQLFPHAKVITTRHIAEQIASDLADPTFQQKVSSVFPGKLPTDILFTPEPVEHEFTVEGQKVVIVKTGHTDTNGTSALWVPSIRLLASGDAVYNNVHPFLTEGGLKKSRLEWIATLDMLAALDPVTVIGGHVDPTKPLSPSGIEETKTYIQNFDKFDDESSTQEELYQKITEYYPTRLNPGSAWGGAKAAKAAEQKNNSVPLEMHNAISCGY